MSETRGWLSKAVVLGAAVVLGVAMVVISVGGNVATAAKPQPPPPPRFVDNGNGTISDRQTGLVWEKKLAEDGSQGGNCAAGTQADRSIHCVNNTYQWSSSGTDPDGALFTDFLARINTELSTSADGVTVADVCFAGHCDWRAPNIVELRTILAAACPGGGSPCIDQIFLPTAASTYWSSSSDASVPAFAWFVNFEFGGTGAFYKTSNYYARAVRGGS